MWHCHCCCSGYRRGAGLIPGLGMYVCCRHGQGWGEGIQRNPLISKDKNDIRHVKLYISCIIFILVLTGINAV